MEFEQIIFLLEIIGTVAFAATGALTAIDKNMDIFGTVFLGVIAALGGGVIRDLLVGNIPPNMFSNYSYLLTAVLCSLVLFIVAYILDSGFKNKFIDNAINILDAVGLGVFTITGINTGISFGFEENVFFLVFLGMTTGIGGGMIRDVLVKEIPFVLTKKIYAVASIAGGIVYCLLLKMSLNTAVSTFISIGLIFLIRVLASLFKIDLPRPQHKKKIKF